MSEQFGLPIGTLPYDAYLQIDGHPGESGDTNHEGWNEIKQYRHDVDQKVAASFSASGAPTAGQAAHGYFWVCKEIDKSSPKLFTTMLKGNAISEIKLEVCTQAGEKTPYLVITLKNSIVAAIRSLAQPLPPEVEALPISKPCEWVAFAYGQIEWNYTEMDHETGATKGSIVSHWNRKTNEGG